MTTTQTALMPVDPAVSPAQASRILTIRANLLPEEIRAGRSARRTRFLLIGAVLAVIAVMAGWYLYAVQQVTTAQDNLTMATDQVQRIQNEKKKYSGVTATINDVKTVEQDLKTLLGTDLPWATNMDNLREDAVAADVQIGTISGSLSEAPAAGAATAATPAGVVAALSIAGTASDKKHVAAFLDKLATHPGFTDPYLTTATQDDNQVTYTLTFKLTSAALCGRFTTACKTGGN
ncbi:PilN domain-containing protein [Paractinoplanes hotanensis]|uniref:PilN domain-containing protein n=1 Tax=Paractinoplanes hotanensis TaxID=2906497 RepID=A0ABT0Y4P8_9ACTN|nr:PilN domain-containing protein [Actinoplanes hotanensis]MCM4080835.1 PilN domain-containing protein [Actinoplanes hotanensis]